jgi:putative ABC transport system permease protein
MRFLCWLALRELWARRWRTLLALSALALSVGLVVATGSLGALMQISVATPAPLLGRSADLWISSAYDVDYDLPGELAARVKAVPGVGMVQPVLRRPVRVKTPPASAGMGPRADNLTMLGVDVASYFEFHNLMLAAGRLPTADKPGLVALAPWSFVRELGLGMPVTVTTPSGEAALHLSGLLEVESLAAAQQGLVLYAPLETVAGLWGLKDTVTTLEVRLAPGASPRQVRAELEQILGPAYAVSRASRSGRGAQLWQCLVLGALLFVDALTMTGSALLVYAVFASAARARRRQIGLLRAAGALQSQVLALLLLEAVLLGLAGSILGLALGLLFSRLGAGLVLEGGSAWALPSQPASLPLPVGSVLLAVALGLLGSLAGALGPAVGAARQPPIMALLATPHEPPRHMGDGWLGRSLTLLARSRLGQAFPVEVRLAVANLLREQRRAALVVATLGLILAMALGSVGVLSLLNSELSAGLGRLTGGDYLVLPGLTTISLRELAGQDTSDVPPLTPGLLAALEDLGSQVWLMGGTTADVQALQVFPGQPTLLLDVEGYAQMGGFRFEAGDWPGALEAFRQGPAVLLTPVVARRLGVSLGDAVRLHTLLGPVDFRVAGIGDSEFTTCVLDLADGAALLGSSEVNAVMVQVRPGRDADAVWRALLDAVQTHGGTLLPLSQASAQLSAVFRRVQQSISLLIGMSGLVAMLGVVNAMLSSVAERRREIGLLRAVGATRPQVTLLMLAEMAVLGAVAALIGTALGWGVTIAFLGTARIQLGLGEEVSSSLAAWLPLVASSLAALALWPLLTMLGGLAPALHASRLPVIKALYEIPPG